MLVHRVLMSSSVICSSGNPPPPPGFEVLFYMTVYVRFQLFGFGCDGHGNRHPFSFRPVPLWRAMLCCAVRCCVLLTSLQAALRQQQQRLLLLRHASKCPAEGEQCKVTPHCQAMKRLWKHIAECKNQQCHVRWFACGYPPPSPLSPPPSISPPSFPSPFRFVRF